MNPTQREGDSPSEVLAALDAKSVEDLPEELKNRSSLKNISHSWRC